MLITKKIMVMEETEEPVKFICDGCKAEFEVFDPHSKKKKLLFRATGTIKIEMPYGSEFEGDYTGDLCDGCFAKLKLLLPSLQFKGE